MPFRIASSLSKAIVFFTLALSAQTPVTGLRARATPADYAVSQSTKMATFAASLVPADQVRHLFAVDISKKYVVFEVAVYPSPIGSAAVDPGDFFVKSGSTASFVRPTDASTIAALIQDRNTPGLPSRGPQVTTAVMVEHESGPGYHGTYTAAEVGVDNNPAGFPPPLPPRPGSSPQDRATLEAQLSEKALPPGTFTAPVAGFLYFAADQAKKVKGSYDLECVNDDPARVDLLIPGKVKIEEQRISSGFPHLIHKMSYGKV